MKLRQRFFFCVAILVMFSTLTGTVYATGISGLQQQINQNQSNLDKANKELSQYEAERAEQQTILDDQKSEMMNLMQEVVYIESAISEKQASIDLATKQLEEAGVMRDEQYEAMMVRIQYMYERGNENYFEILFGSDDLTDFLNRAEYVENLYAYDSNMLHGYENLIADIDTMRNTLEQDKKQLVYQQERLKEHQYELERIMSELQKKIDDYDDLVADAKKRAEQYKKQIADDQAAIEDIKRAEEQANKPQGGGNVSVSGSGTGADIAKFALGYVGKCPYVWAGNSLTTGVDCSGFVVQVYKAFGYSLGTRTSFGMRSIGKEVSLANAKAGDIICYSGHVAIYLGNNKIVHAKDYQYGIVTDPVYYGAGGRGPAVLTVRRIIN